MFLDKNYLIRHCLNCMQLKKGKSGSSYKYGNEEYINLVKFKMKIFMLKKL